MKAVLLFYLNSLGIVVVFAQTERPAAECLLTKAGHEYAGPLNVTRSGRTCQRWDSNQPHVPYFKSSTLFPDGNASDAGNKCRNPDIQHKKGVWCYTTDPNTRWEACDVAFCGFTSPVFPEGTWNSESSSQTSQAQTQTSTPRTTPFSTIDSIAPHPKNPGTFPTSSSSQKTIQPRTTPAATDRLASTKSSTRTIGLTPRFLPDSNSSTHVVIIVSTIGLIAVLCVIVAIIIVVWKRRSTGLSPSYRIKSSSQDRNQLQTTVAIDAKSRQNNSIDDPDDVRYKQLAEIVDVSTDHIAMTHTEVAYKTMSKDRLL